VYARVAEGPIRAFVARFVPGAFQPEPGATKPKHKGTKKKRKHRHKRPKHRRRAKR
jgi:hypothetical protein